MYRWERRLRDLAYILKSCHEHYFEPELFRLHTNQFLQTSRTVTFLIQKNKASVPDFEKWYQAVVVLPWKDDPIMQWAKESRNTIEKEGDLDLYSAMQVTLIFSYLEEQDIKLNFDKNKLLHAGVKKLMRFAQTKLPTGVADGAYIKIERKWIANTLANKELLGALTYIYARCFEACNSLASYLNSQIDNSIPSPSEFDQLSSDSRHVMYYYLNGRKIGHYKTIKQDIPGFDTLPEDMRNALRKSINQAAPKSLEENVESYGKITEITFNTYGYHIPMLFFFDVQFKPIDFITTAFEGAADKYAFWRSISERILIRKPYSLIWISESWHRKLADYQITPIRNLEIIGESLDICGLDCTGRFYAVSWKILRNNLDGSTQLVRVGQGIDAFNGIPNCFIPAAKAMGIKGATFQGN